MAEILVPLIWVPILAYVAWCWAGRSRRARSWAGNPFGHGIVLGWAPAVGLMFFSFWLHKVLGDLVSPVTSSLFLLSFIVLILGLFTPRWWGPRWFRRMSDEEKVDVHKPLNAAGMAAISGRGPGRSAAKAADAFGGRGELLGEWQGGYVYDADTTEREHGMARCGTVDGTLMLCTEGLTFAASKAEDTLREKPMVLMLPQEEIRGVLVVPPRAGADGVQRKGFWFRSWFPRLVVETGDGSYLFEVDWGRATQAADRITSITGRVA